MKKTLCLTLALTASCLWALKTDAGGRYYGRFGWGGHRWGGWGYRGVGIGLGFGWGRGWYGRGWYGRGWYGGGWYGRGWYGAGWGYRSPFYAGYGYGWGSRYPYYRSYLPTYYRVAPTPVYYSPTYYSPSYCGVCQSPCSACSCQEVETVIPQNEVLTTQSQNVSNLTVAARPSLLLKLSREIRSDPATLPTTSEFSATTRFAYNPTAGSSQSVEPPDDRLETQVVASQKGR